MRNANFTFSGGFPLEQDTLKFMQDEYQDIQKFLKSFLKVPNTGNYILAGLTATGTPDQYNDGWVCMDGDILFVATGTGTKIAMSETITTATYQDTSVNDTYTLRVGVIGASGTDITAFITVPKYQEATTLALGLVQLATEAEVSNLTNATKAITPFTLSSGLRGLKNQTGVAIATFETGFERYPSGNATITFWKNQFKQVRFAGAVVKCTKVGGASPTDLLFTMPSTPVNYRPYNGTYYANSPLLFVCPVNNASTSYSPLRTVIITIDFNGEVRLKDGVMNQDDYIDLRHVQYDGN